MKAKAIALISLVVLISGCAGYDRREDRREERREDRRSQLQTHQSPTMLSATQVGVPAQTV